jgi:ESCRT-II complex subunit VPS25
MAAASAAFSFPPLFNFPPLFTLQPVDATRAKQLEQWKSIIIGWHQAKRQTLLVVKDWPHWSNSAIERSLPEDARIKVIDFLVAHGNAEWVDDAKTRCKVYFQTPAELAAVVWAWADEHSMFNTVYTLYELSTGVIVAGAGMRVIRECTRMDGGLLHTSPRYHAAFEGMDTHLLFKAAEALASQAKVMKWWRRRRKGSVDCTTVIRSPCAG